MTAFNTAQQMEPMSQETASIFPARSPRLDTLITQYCDDKGVPVLKTSKEDTAKTYEISVSQESVTKNISDLTPDELQKVMKRIEGIDYTVSSDILNFGSADGRKRTKYAADMIIAKHTLAETSSVIDPVTSLIDTLRSNNFTSISRLIAKVKNANRSGKQSLLSSMLQLLRLRNNRKKMYRALKQHERNRLSLTVLEVEMENQRITLEQDIEVYEQMLQEISEQVKELDLDYAALTIMIEDAEAKRNSLINAKTSGDKSSGVIHNDSVEIKTLQHVIDRMQRKRHSIQTTRVATLQTIAMLYNIVTSNETICEKINEVVELLIPLWNWQYAVAIGIFKQHEALRLQKNARKSTSQVLVSNAKNLKNNIITAQNDIYAAAIAVEDLQLVQTYIEDMANTVQIKSREADAKVRNGIQRFEQTD